MSNRDSSINLRHLCYFEGVAEELSFSGASRRLHIVQPALSRAVRELEKSLLLEGRGAVRLGSSDPKQAALEFSPLEESN